MEKWQERTGMLVGATGLERLAMSRVTVVGLGGVGSVAAEMLVRAGVGSIVIIDNDDVSETNINRQLPALHSTVGKRKCDVVGDRLLDINPDLNLVRKYEYLTEENVAELVDPARTDLVVDAIDTLSPKVALICHCLRSGIPLVSSMGAGAKYDVSSVRIADISKTYQCPLAHMLRKRLHKMGISTGFKAVFSVEKPSEGAMVQEESRNKKSQTGTISYLPVAFGCACAQAAVARLVDYQVNN